VCFVVGLAVSTSLAEARADDASAPVVVVSSAAAVATLVAADDVGVIYSAGNHLWRVPVAAGATPTELVATSKFSDVDRLVLDRSEALFIDGEALRSVPASGGPPRIVARAQAFFDLAVSGDRVFWSETRGIAVAPRAGGAPIYLSRQAPRPPARLAVDATAVTWGDGAEVFMDSPPHTAELSTVPVGGGARKPAHAWGNADAATLLGDGSALYWAESNFEDKADRLDVVSLARTPGAKKVTLGKVPSGVSRVAQDDANVYFATWDPLTKDGAITRVSKAGTGADVVGKPKGQATGLAITASRIVWAEPGSPSGSRVLALAKPPPRGPSASSAVVVPAH
jgi:hypothetical protein